MRNREEVRSASLVAKADQRRLADLAKRPLAGHWNWGSVRTSAWLVLAEKAARLSKLKLGDYVRPGDCGRLMTLRNQMEAFEELTVDQCFLIAKPPKDKTERIIRAAMAEVNAAVESMGIEK